MYNLSSHYLICLCMNFGGKNVPLEETGFFFCLKKGRKMCVGNVYDQLLLYV